MIKVIGFILIVASSTILGFSYGEKFKNRVRELKELQRGLYVLKNEINFTHALLPEALNKVYEKCEEPIAGIFKDASELLLNNEEYDVNSCFIKSIDKRVDKLSLNKDDISIFLDFTKSLGEMDIEGHNDMFALTLENLDKAINNAEYNIDKNVKMYRYLGFSFGAMIGIILI